MPDPYRLVEHYLARLADPRDRDNAFHSLVEADDNVLPFLERAFDDQPDDSIRELIVEVIWQHRAPYSIPFLARTLHDRSPAVWNQALDGLVTIGGPDAVRSLARARARLAPDDARKPWLDDAIESLR